MGKRSGESMKKCPLSMRLIAIRAINILRSVHSVGPFGDIRLGRVGAGLTVGGGECDGIWTEPHMVHRTKSSVPEQKAEREIELAALNDRNPSKSLPHVHQWFVVPQTWGATLPICRKQQMA